MTDYGTAKADDWETATRPVRGDVLDPHTFWLPVSDCAIAAANRNNRMESRRWLARAGSRLRYWRRNLGVDVPEESVPQNLDPQKQIAEAIRLILEAIDMQEFPPQAARALAAAEAHIRTVWELP
jgi:hypothetical protein